MGFFVHGCQGDGSPDRFQKETTLIEKIKKSTEPERAVLAGLAADSMKIYDRSTE